MNEKSLLVLEQYDLNIEGTYRYKGNYGCVAKEGRFILQEYENSNDKMVTMDKLYKFLEENDFVTDSVIANKEGEYVSVSPDGYNTYILKKWFDARECDREVKDDILMGARELGRWHRVCHEKFELEEELKGFHPGKDLQKAFHKHNKEMINIKNYIKKRRNKNYFEIYLQNILEDYYQQGIEALENLKKLNYLSEYSKAVIDGKINYGNFNYHNFLIKDNRVILINMCRINYAPPIQDLYDYLRKIMEKSEWDKDLGMSIIAEYDKENVLGQREKLLLKMLLSYPEKFWKIINYYYNSNKAWYSEKNEEKLIQFREQEEKRWEFINDI